MNLGVIDVGSNSVRLLFNGQKQTINTQLSEKNVPGGELFPEPMRRTAEAVFYFADFVKKQGGTVRAFATEAVRSASNGAEFVKLLQDNGVTTEVLSPETEAKIGFDGAYDGNGIQAVLDVGGASSELIVGSRDGIIYSHSLSLGSVRTRDLNLLPPALNKTLAEKITEYGLVPKFSFLVGIGGTVTSLVAVRDKVDPYEKSKIHLKTITVEEIEKTVDYILSVPMEERKNIPGLHPKKITVVPAGGTLVAEIMRYLGVEKMTVSENDNLEGYLKLISEKN